jgi:excisionase family DNA binding protein
MVKGVSEPIDGSRSLEALVTVDEAAAFLRVQVGTVYLWAETERIPSYKIGNLRRFRLSDLEAHVRAQREGPPEQSSRVGAARPNPSQAGGMMPEQGLTKGRRVWDP